MIDKIEQICERLLKQEIDLDDGYDKDRLMLINNLCQYIIPKQMNTNQLPFTGDDNPVLKEFLNFDKLVLAAIENNKNKKSVDEKDKKS